MKPKGINYAKKNSSIKKYQPPKQIMPEHAEFMSRVGIKLQGMRQEKNHSISFLSRDCGISRNAYSQMELGTVYFSLSNLMKILDYYGLDAMDFFRDL
jgi:DNA-binding XRE family transcriptional regulator